MLANVSTAIGGLGQEKLHSVLTTPFGDDQDAWYFAISFVARLVAYVSTIGLLVIFIFLILKYFGDFGSETTTFEEEVGGETEADSLLPSKRVPFTYGTCDGDLESGKGNCSSSEDLYDGKICIICYDEPRNCFFVPCGHCASCYNCARRIAKGENSVCPVCRRFIRKVRKFVVQ